MDARQDDTGTLLLTYDSSLWSRWLIAATLALLGTAGYDYFVGARGDDRLVGLLAGAATTAISALVLLEQSSFRVDPRSRLIEWQQRWGFRQRAGVIPFADVRHVSVERPIGDSGVPSRRIVLHLANESLLPITIGYRPDNSDQILKAADVLRSVLGQSTPGAEESARVLLQQGRKIDAIKLLVEQEGLSLADAKARLDRTHDR
jgi:hypothetical protein